MAKKEDLPGNFHPEQRLKFSHVSLLVGKGRTAIYAEIAAGIFPPPERDGPRCSRWRAGSVLAYLDSKRLAAASNPLPPRPPVRQRASKQVAEASQ